MLKYNITIFTNDIKEYKLEVNVMGTGNVYQVILNTLISFTILLIITRLLGKKQLSQLTFFNYVTGITIGSIAANMVDYEWAQFKVTIWALVIWALLTVVVSLIILKFPQLSDLLHGQPTIVIKNGKIQYKALSHLGVDIDNLVMMLREKDVFTIKEVDYAILETNGQLSILKYPEHEKVIKKDLSIKTQAIKYLPMDLIIDGKVVKKNLQEVNLSHEWLLNQLKSRGIKNVKDVLYAQLQTDGTVYIDKKS
jgi:uncharacterized membrane protein YcaP (DUF421 family)